MESGHESFYSQPINTTCVIICQYWQLEASILHYINYIYTYFFQRETTQKQAQPMTDKRLAKGHASAPHSEGWKASFESISQRITVQSSQK